MNRRGYFKRMLVLCGMGGAASISIFNWLDFNKSIDSTRFAEKKAILAELVDLIIPTTDTPGAKVAGVHDFIVKTISSCSSSREQHRFLAGIEDLEDYSVKHHSHRFLLCNKDEKIEILNHFANNGEYSFRIIDRINRKLLGTPFYVKLKELTVEGYCCSKIGATEGLAYDYIPGTHEACIPILTNQKSWATK